MPSTVLNRAAFVVLATLLNSAASYAATVVVGNCNGNKVKYSTIQAAVDVANANDTVSVCPGTYAEQVVITKPLTLKGLINGTSGATVITVPATGLVPNVTMASGAILAAQVVVTNTLGVTLTNLTIDGSSGPCATDVGAALTAGIALNNLLTADSKLATTVKNAVVRNELGGCGLSAGILSEQSVLLIDSNSIHTVEGDAVHLVGGTGTISNNTIESCSLAGVSLTNVSAASVKTNTTSSNRFGVSLNATSNITVSGNTMGPYVSYGLYSTNASGSIVTQNGISATGAGIYLNGSMGDKVTGNTVVRAQAIGIVDIQSRGGNLIKSNTVNESPYGLSDVFGTGSAMGDVLSSNVFLNVTTTTTTIPY